MAAQVPQRPSLWSFRVALGRVSLIRHPAGHVMRHPDALRGALGAPQRALSANGWLFGVLGARL